MQNDRGTTNRFENISNVLPSTSKAATATGLPVITAASTSSSSPAPAAPPLHLSTPSNGSGRSLVPTPQPARISSPAAFVDYQRPESSARSASSQLHDLSPRCNTRPSPRPRASPSPPPRAAPSPRFSVSPSPPPPPSVRASPRSTPSPPPRPVAPLNQQQQNDGEIHSEDDGGDDMLRARRVHIPRRRHREGKDKFPSMAHFFCLSIEFIISIFFSQRSSLLQESHGETPGDSSTEP